MQSHNIRLIDNTYDLDIARQLLDGLLTQKITFVKNMIRTIDPVDVVEMSQLESRLEELKAEKRSLDILLEEFDGEHAEMEIGCTVVMSVRKLDLV